MNFKYILETKTGFISAHWDGTNETENKIKELTKATIQMYSTGWKGRRRCLCYTLETHQNVEYCLQKRTNIFFFKKRLCRTCNI